MYTMCLILLYNMVQQHLHITIISYLKKIKFAEIKQFLCEFYILYDCFRI